MTNPFALCLIWLLFFFYCVVGYAVECTYCAIIDGHFSNRGFLNGPYLPIYGSGAVASTLLFQGMTNPVEIFLLGGALCCALEWVTSYTMEKLYHARWWDYSHLPLNVQGRFWIGGFVEFGIGIDLVVLVVSPRMAAWLERLPSALALVLAVATFLCMTVDLVISHKGAARMRDVMDQLAAEARTKADELATQAYERAEAAAAEAREQAEAAIAETREHAEAMMAEAQERVDAAQAAREQAEAIGALARERAEAAGALARERAEAAGARARERADGLRARATQRSLARREDWERALEWSLGTFLRSAEGQAPDLRPDLAQIPALEEVSARLRERMGGQERRMLEAFPRLRPSNYRSLARELAERFDERDRS